jgi:hypothetical protein
MTKYKKHTIEVTQEHIDGGIPTSCTECAISLAFKDSLVKAYGGQYLVDANMSNGEVSLHYSRDGGDVFGANLDNNCFSVGEYKSEDLQDKIDAFVDEYDTRFVNKETEFTTPKEGFTPKHCVPFTFDVSLPV